MGGPSLPEVRRSVTGSNGRRAPAAEAIFLSMYTAKGLEFPCVAIAGLGLLGRRGEPDEEGVRLTYVGVTRATHEALLTYSTESALVQRLIT